VGTAYKLVWLPVSSRSPPPPPAQFGNPFAPDLFEPYRHTHEHPNQSGNLYSRIPPLNVISGIGLGNPDLLRLGECRIKAEPLFHAAENDIGCRVQNAAKSVKMNHRQTIAEHREDGGSVHHR